MNSSFDSEGFYSALDAQRLAKKKTWKQVANETKVAASTLTRMGQGKRPDVDGLAALASWSNLDVRKFYRDLNDIKELPEPIAQITTILRADRQLPKESISALEIMLKTAYEQMRIKDGQT